MVYDQYTCAAWVPDADPEAMAKGCGTSEMEKIPADSHEMARREFCHRHPTVKPENVKVRRWDEPIEQPIE